MKTRGQAKWLLFGGFLSAVLPGPVAYSQQMVSVSSVRLHEATLSNQTTYKHLPLSFKTLSGRLITLPTPNRLTLIIGALASDGDNWASGWQQQAAALCARHAVLDCYQATQDSRKTRQIVPADLRDRTAVLGSHAPTWKSAIASQSQDNVYAILLAPDGTPLWQAAGQSRDALPAAALDELLRAGGY